MCNTPRGRARDKQVNISNLLIVRRTDIESDFGLSPQVRAASQASGRRPADRTPAAIAAEADQDAIRQAKTADSDAGLSTYLRNGRERRFRIHSSNEDTD